MVTFRGRTGDLGHGPRSCCNLLQGTKSASLSVTDQIDANGCRCMRALLTTGRVRHPLTIDCNRTTHTHKHTMPPPAGFPFWPSQISPDYFPSCLAWHSSEASIDKKAVGSIFEWVIFHWLVKLGPTYCPVPLSSARLDHSLGYVLASDKGTHRKTQLLSRY